jgi:hypothetical protein
MKAIFPIVIAAALVSALALSSIDSLIQSTKEPEDIPFHTPAHPQNSILPSTITEHITIGPNQGIVTVHETITIKNEGKLTLLPGTVLAFDEYAGIRVFGSLQALGTEEDSILLISNESNERNRNWNGITLEHNSINTITHTTFHHASPSISCMENSKVVIGQGNFYKFGNIDIYGNC